MIVKHVATNAEQPAIRIAGGLHLPDLVAFGGSCGEIFAAVFDPFDRMLQNVRNRRDHEFFGMKHGLGAEAAADIGRDHAQSGFVHRERRRENRLGAMRHLRAVQTVSDSSAGSKRASTPRVSMDPPQPLCRRKRRGIVTAAPANAASISP